MEVTLSQEEKQSSVRSENKENKDHGSREKKGPSDDILVPNIYVDNFLVRLLDYSNVFRVVLFWREAEIKKFGIYLS